MISNHWLPYPSIFNVIDLIFTLLLLSPFTNFNHVCGLNWNRRLLKYQFHTSGLVQIDNIIYPSMYFLSFFSLDFNFKGRIVTYRLWVSHTYMSVVENWFSHIVSARVHVATSRIRRIGVSRCYIATWPNFLRVGTCQNVFIVEGIDTPGQLKAFSSRWPLVMVWWRLKVHRRSFFRRSPCHGLHWPSDFGSYWTIIPCPRINLHWINENDHTFPSQHTWSFNT